MRRRIQVVALALLAVLPDTCLGWNGEGHQLIGWIAEERLSEKSKAAITELLGEGAALSDAQVVSWADQIRRERRQTAPWHYVNIPVDAEGYDGRRDGKGGENVIAKVQHFAEVLSDRSLPHEQRVEALKFLIHFVGDLHQPLHCADRNGDRGGNGCLVFFPGQRKAVNLHQVWDTFMLRSRKRRQSVSEYGTKLKNEIDREQAAAWAKGTPLDWVTEAWTVAKEKVYPKVAADGSVPTLSEEYVTEGGLLADVQIKKAGVRLAKMLDAAFD